MPKEKLTIERGLEIQAQHLKGWYAVLRPEFSERLHREVEHRNSNDGYQSGYDVWRGDSIMEWVQNVVNKIV